MLRTALILKQTLQMTLEDVCDFGIEPRAGVSVQLGLVLMDNVICPEVTLTFQGRTTVERHFVFSDGYRITEFLSHHNLNEWKDKARLTVGQLEPVTPDVILLVREGEDVFEHHVTTTDLAPFFFFPFEDGEEPFVEPCEISDAA